METKNEMQINLVFQSEIGQQFITLFLLPKENEKNVLAQYTTIG
jgi:hypothetical protein